MQTDRILSVRDVTNRCGLSRSSVYAKAKDQADDFPAAVRFSERICGWYESEVQAWIGGRRAVRHAGTAPDHP